MSCEKTRTDLPLYIDDALTPARSEQVERHLSTCPDCRLLLTKLKEDQYLLRSLPAVTPPDGFREALLQRIACEKPGKPSPARYFLPRLSSLAAVLVIMILAGNLYLFPDIWPGTPVAGGGENTKMGLMMAPTADPIEGDGAPTAKDAPTSRQADDMFAMSALPEEESAPNLWLWSGVAGCTLFLLGLCFWLYRYRYC